MQRRTCVPCARLIGVMATWLMAAATASANQGTLKNTSHAVVWSGTLHRSDAPLPEVVECVESPCQRFDLVVELPSGAWNQKPGGVQVALRWFSDADNLRLFVYREGALVASGPGIISTAQSVLIPFAPGGQYAVYVAYDGADSFDDTVEYEARAEVEYPPNPKPTRPLLPDLTVRAQRRVTFDTPFIDFFEPPPPPGETCYGTEAQEAGAVTCLRFDQVAANTDEGTLHLFFVLPHDPTSPVKDVVQRVFWSDSPSHFDDRVVGTWEFHEAHQHYHFNAFAQSRLWASDAAGARHGDSPVRVGRKVSFCAADVELDNWSGKGDGPRTYNAPDCLFPQASDANNDYLIQGITRGWADVYEWYLPGQYIEVTGVPDGVYILETEIDPEKRLLESNESNNCASVYVRLTNVDSPARHAELLGPGPACK